MHGGRAAIAMRRTQGPIAGAIDWHFDGGYASRTIQIALNDDSEYGGGRLCCFTPQHGVQVLRRSAGDLTSHGRDVLHAVTRLTSGTRYGLFVVDEINGLGEKLVVEPTLKRTKKILSLLRKEDDLASSIVAIYHHALPFENIAIEDIIGAGSFKTVFSGTCRNFPDENVCIIKRQGDLHSLNPDAIQETNKSPYLLKIYGCSINLGSCYTIVERAPLGSLREQLRRLDEIGGALKLQVTLEIAQQVGRAMEFLHDRNMLHRNLAARNVLIFAFSDRVHQDVAVKVTDFDLVMQPLSSEQLFNYHSLHMRWCSPEVFQRRAYSKMSDVWAFGVLVWEIFTLAMVPYFELASEEHVQRAVLLGLRLSRPDSCPEAIFESMISPCWRSCSSRPSFAGLNVLLQGARDFSSV